MTDFPERGQAAPNFWNGQLQAYIDERDAANAQALADAVATYYTKTQSDARFLSKDPASLGAANLDSITTDGVYKQETTANATFARKYPQENIMGTLVVAKVNSANMTQAFTIGGGAGAVFPLVYFRRMNAGAWGAWRLSTSNTLELTAGLRVRVWDDVNKRDQLVYSDTGLRSIPAQLQNGWTATGVYLERRAYQVTLYVEGLNASAMTNQNFVSLPSGFDLPPNNLGRGLIHSSAAPTATYRVSAPSANILAVASATTAFPLLYGSVTWRTDSAWPATLPGTAVGSIPNV